ncbi:hypothetical protein HF521_008797 [Silurus meridionalis]|uniref:Uncharacterized protein n=1 Tax=Silurus meridionalis TaxID=175797 RepID=A0A8T0ARF8_SILME|nr:hypothetical protein HF521_008797 [Silurus meridionalis]
MDINNMLDFYRHYKFYHFFSICFGLGCGMCSYRPFYPLVMPILLTVFCMVVFEAMGCCFGLPPHTKRCKGPPFHWRDALWGLVFALPEIQLQLRLDRAACHTPSAEDLGSVHKRNEGELGGGRTSDCISKRLPHTHGLTVILIHKILEVALTLTLLPSMHCIIMT